MGKLLNEIKITNNKIYEHMPEGRLRHSRDGDSSPGTNTSLPSPPRPNGTSRPTHSASSVDGNGVSTGESNQPAKALQVPPNGQVRRKGRPRMFSAQVVSQSEGEFMVLIKFNVRNKLARRYFGIAPPAAPPVESLSRLRPPQSRIKRTDSHDDVEAVSVGRTRRKRGSRSQINNRQVPQTRARDSGQETRLARHSARNRFRPASDKPTLSSEATERLSESLERDLPYHGVLPFPECIINHTDPTASDRKVFEDLAKEAAQQQTEVQNEMLAGSAPEDSPAATPIPQGASHYYSRSQIEKLQFREYLIDTWYSSPYPEEYARHKVLYTCEFCLKYMSSPQAFFRHQAKSCNFGNNHPPGVEIYRDPVSRIAFWEVDGRKNIEYCQSLCLLAKLFLNSKTLYYDVEPFVFYVLTEIDEQDSSTYHFVGYFSKEKLNNSDYNVSCILTLPIYQRKGYGSLMIDFSYLLSRREFKYGTPEKPLSDLGLVSYRNYWKIAVAQTLRRLHDDFSSRGMASASLTLENIAQLTGMKPSDVVFALEQLDALLKHKQTGSYAISLKLELVDAVIAKWESRNYVQLNPEFLLWKPLIYGPSGGINSAPALTLIPQAGSSAPMVSNSISMISEFLKDDIDNPYTFEEEAYKAIEVSFAENNSRSERRKFEADDYHLCHPDIEIATQEKPSLETDDVKLAAPNSDDIESESGSSDTESEEFVEDNGEPLTADRSIGALIQENDLVSEEDADELFEEDSEPDKGEVSLEDDEEVDDESEKSDEEEEEGEEEEEEEIPVIPIAKRRPEPRKTRSHHHEQLAAPAPAPMQNNSRRTTRQRR